MIKAITFALLLAIPTLSEVRSSYTKSIDDEDEAERLFDRLNTSEAKADALLLAYCGATRALMAKHSINPYTKLKCLKEGSAMLNSAVEKSPKHIEVRYLRYSVEYNVPDFLDYRQHLAVDKKCIVDGIIAGSHGLTKAVLKDIVAYMLKNAELDAATKAKLNKAIA